MTYYKFDGRMYLDLMNNLIVGKITPQKFQQMYMEQWEIDRDKQFSSITPEMEYEEKKIDLLLGRMKITIEQHKNKWCKIRNISEQDSLIQDIINRGYTTCDVYWDDATEEDLKNGQLDDNGLIEEITKLYAELKEVLKNEKNVR
ncbi:MAG: hypothetical protein LBE13_03805 [Bacteroidales bacterium]|jgi:hypothetical protein|nr:hypothetical protein [Bacteroidales bacterium]